MAGKWQRLERIIINNDALSEDIAFYKYVNKTDKWTSPKPVDKTLTNVDTHLHPTIFIIFRLVHIQLRLEEILDHEIFFLRVPHRHPALHN